MTSRSENVSRSQALRLRNLAEWARNSIKSSSDLVHLGDSKFRHRWSRYGVENTLAATELWEGAWKDHTRAKRELDQAEAELGRLRKLTPEHESAPSDDPAAFPALRKQLSEAQARLRSTRQQQKEADSQRDKALSDGRAHLAELKALCAERRKELEALRQTLATEQNELRELHARIEEQTGVRSNLQQLVTAIDGQFRR